MKKHTKARIIIQLCFSVKGTSPEDCDEAVEEMVSEITNKYPVEFLDYEDAEYLESENENEDKE